jgi:hypothetical protein
MKFSGFENIDAGVRSAILISVAAAYFAFDFGFELGAHGTIFFEKVFFVWSMSLALLIIFVIVPKRLLPVPPKLWVATAVPTLWVLVSLANRAAPDELLFRHALTILGFAAVLVSFPYVIYVITSVIYPDFTKMNRAAPKVGIAAVVGTMVLAGYLVGANHGHFLTCEDFKLSGQHVPTDCRQR